MVVRGKDIDKDYFNGETPHLVDHGIEMDVEAIAKALVNIYQQKYDIDHDIDENLYRDTVRILQDAIDNGYADAVEDGITLPDEKFREVFEHSAEVFSAFRVHKMQNDIAAEMLDANGNVKPFREFVKDVTPYIDHQNRAWLQTEYDTAILRAQNAAAWKQFKDEEDVYPNLEWVQSTSPNPGQDHVPFWGTVLPVNDPFWDEHKPGDRWNCKCELRQTDKDTNTPPTGANKQFSASPGLESNPFKAKEVFSDKHPYFPKSCSSCPFAGSKLMALAHDLAKGKDCMHCQSVSKCIERSNRRTEKREKLRSLNAHNDRKEFRSLQKSLLKTLTKKKRLVLDRKDFYTGHVFFGKNEMEQVMKHCFSALDIEAAKRMHTILRSVKNGRYEPIDMSRPNYKKKMTVDGVLNYVSYKVEHKGTIYILKCRVCRDGRTTCEYPYSIKEKESD